MQHIFKVDQIAVVHMLREIVGVVEVNKPLVVRVHNLEEIQDFVENQIMDRKAFAVARKYITYRYSRALGRILPNRASVKQRAQKLHGKRPVLILRWNRT